MQYAIADFIARHAVAVLIGITLVALAISAALWHAVETLAPRAWAIVIDVWNRARQTQLALWLRRLPLIGRFLDSTLTMARYLGIVAIVGLALSAGAIVLFTELADEIGAGESLAEFDVALTAALRERVPLETLRFFAVVTHLGDVEVLFAIGLVVFIVLAVRQLKQLAAAWALTTLSGALLNSILKTIFERSRPLHDHGLTVEDGWSFPSGHASGSMLVYGLLTYVIVRSTPPAWHIPTALVGLALVIFVGSSRVLLQVHYLSDVLAGYASAAAWIGICIAALEAARWREQQRAPATAAATSSG